MAGQRRTYDECGQLSGDSMAIRDMEEGGVNDSEHRYRGWTDRQMLAILLDRSERIEKAVFGPPSTAERIAVLESEMDDVEERITGPKERAAVRVGVPIALLASLGTILRAFLGVEF